MARLAWIGRDWHGLERWRLAGEVGTGVSRRGELRFVKAGKAVSGTDRLGQARRGWAGVV